MTIVAPDIALRAEIGGIGSAGALRLRLGCCGNRTDRGRSGNHERASDKGCPDQTPHDGLLVDPDVRDNGQQSRQFQGNPSNRNRPAMNGPARSLC
jgi:hypothetical protein